MYKSNRIITNSETKVAIYFFSVVDGVILPSSPQLKNRQMDFLIIIP